MPQIAFEVVYTLQKRLMPLLKNDQVPEHPRGVRGAVAMEGDKVNQKRFLL
jgi:hypothetical protein